MYYWWNCEEMRAQGYDDCKARYGTNALTERFYPQALDPRGEPFAEDSVGLGQDEILKRFQLEDGAEGKALLVFLVDGVIVGVFNIIFQCPPVCPKV